MPEGKREPSTEMHGRVLLRRAHAASNLHEHHHRRSPRAHRRPLASRVSNSARMKFILACLLAQVAAARRFDLPGLCNETDVFFHALKRHRGVPGAPTLNAGTQVLQDGRRHAPGGPRARRPRGQRNRGGPRKSRRPKSKRGDVRSTQTKRGDAEGTGRERNRPLAGTRRASGAGTRFERRRSRRVDAAKAPRPQRGREKRRRRHQDPQTPQVGSRRARSAHTDVRTHALRGRCGVLDAIAADPGAAATRRVAFVALLRDPVDRLASAATGAGADGRGGADAGTRIVRGDVAPMPPSEASRSPAAGCHVDIPRGGSRRRRERDRIVGREPVRARGRPRRRHDAVWKSSEAESRRRRERPGWTPGTRIRPRGIAAPRRGQGTPIVRERSRCRRGTPIVRERTWRRSSAAAGDRGAAGGTPTAA